MGGALRLTIFAFAIIFFSQANGSAQSRFFTVRDSIMMAHFLESPQRDLEVAFSPDKRYFAVVTSRGIIQSNTIESTIWLFNSDVVLSYLQKPRNPPVPKIVARWAAIPRINYTPSYEPVISDLQWTPDSKTIVFLLQNSQGQRQIWAAGRALRSIHALTPPGRDVAGFTVADGTIVYEAEPSIVHVPSGKRINASAFDVTGLGLTDILFPQLDDRPSSYVEIWSIKNGKNIFVTGPNKGAPSHVLNTYPLPSILAVSPDGNNLVVVSAVTKIPASWQSYEPSPFLPYHKGRIRSTDMLTQYTLINSKSKSVQPLLDAPLGIDLNYLDSTGAIWSADGKRLVLMNTFLPINEFSATERKNGIRPCAASVIDLNSRFVSCVAFTRQAGLRGPYAIRAAFGKSDDDVVLDFDDDVPDFGPNPADRTEELFHYHAGIWRRLHVSKNITALHSSGRLRISVKQDLNAPPVLWATDLRTNRAKKLWDPNPWLHDINLGRASVFHWTDTTGYVWTGGLVLPPNYVRGKRYPLVIQTHGFEDNQFMSDGEYTTAFAARPLASAGMIVLQIRWRIENLDTLKEAPDQIRGFESAITRLTMDGSVDPRRVGIIGFSRTCYHVESVLIKDPQLFAAASITDGVDESYMQYLLFGENLAGDYNEMYGTAPFGNGLNTWIKKSPGFNLDRIETPLLITAPQSGEVLEEWEIYASLRMQQKPVDLIYLPQIEGYQHILQRPLERWASQQGNVDWFRFWLQGYEDPDPTKRAQYRRWEALRTLQKSH